MASLASWRLMLPFSVSPVSSVVKTFFSNNEHDSP